jgi:hypothetical protein
VLWIARPDADARESLILSAHKPIVMAQYP